MMMMMMMKDEDAVTEMKRTVCVSNLNSCVREEILYELFLQAGPVKKVDIPRDPDGNLKSYAFVEYKHTEAVPYAIALLDGIRLYGRPITLRFSHAHTRERAAPEPAPVRLQNELMEYRCPAQDHPDWTEGFALDPFSLFLRPTQGLCVPPAFPWAWPHPGLVSWSSCSNGLSQALDCTSSRKRRAERNTEAETFRKSRKIQARKTLRGGRTGGASVCL